jgi:hypothetical protein
MPGTPKPKQTATGKMITPNMGQRTKVFTPKTLKKEQLKKNKKPSKGGTGYRNYGSA